HLTTVVLDGAQFTLANDTCSGKTLLAGAQCSVDVTFAPTALGAQTGTLTVTSDAGTSPDHIALTGTAVTPGSLSLSTASATFAGTLVGATSAAQTVTVTNSGGARLHVAGISLTSAEAAQFDLGSDACSGVDLGAGQSCSFDVRFKPTSVGAHAA